MKNLIINVVCDCGKEVIDNDYRQLIKDMVEAGIIREVGEGVETISANLPLCPRAPRLLHVAFCCLSGHAQARWSSQVRTVDS